MEFRHTPSGSREARARCSGWGRKSESATDTARPGTPRSLFEIWPFLTKFLIWKWAIFDENWWNWGALLIWKLTISDEISWKLVKLRRTPYLKINNFRRKLVKICEIQAHSLFENWPFSRKITENLWNWGALLIWKLASFDENWRKSVKLRRAPYLKTGKFRRKLVKICEIEAHSLFENWQVSTKIGENRWNWGALLIWKLAIVSSYCTSASREPPWRVLSGSKTRHVIHELLLKSSKIVYFCSKV